MNRVWLIGLILVGITALGGVVYSHGMGGSGMMGNRGSWSGGHMGPMMGNMGPMMGSSNYMNQGWHCPMMQNMGYQSYYGPDRVEDLTKSDAKNIAGDYLMRLGNPNLKQGKIKETEHEFEVDIVTKDNSLVEKILIDIETGRMRLTY